MLTNKTRFDILFCLFAMLITGFFAFFGCSEGYDSKASGPADTQAKEPGHIGAAAKDPPLSETAVENGRKLVATLGCLGCHTINGQGGNVGPNLSNEANAGRSREWLITQIRDPKKNDPKTLMPAYSTLTKKQVNDIVSYLLTLSTAHSKEGDKESIQVAKSLPASSEPNSFSMEEAGRRWSQVCGQCHNLRSPSEYSDAQWQVAVHHMRIRVPLTGQEQKEILAFLQANN